MVTSSGWLKVYLNNSKGFKAGLRIVTEMGSETINLKSKAALFIKMDIEGGEMAALVGMNKVITRSQRLAMFTEFYPRGLEKAGFSPAAYLNELQKHGFKISLVDEQRQCWETVPDITYLTNYLMNRKLRGINLLCIKGEW